MKYLLIVLFLTGCATTDRGQYSIDTFQDPQCYIQYGGQYGYCDRKDIYTKDGQLR